MVWEEWNELSMDEGRKGIGATIFFLTLQTEINWGIFSFMLNSLFLWHSYILHITHFIPNFSLWNIFECINFLAISLSYGWSVVSLCVSVSGGVCERGPCRCALRRFLLLYGYCFYSKQWICFFSVLLK